MVEEAGHVVRLAGSQAQVEFEKRSACGSCHARTACGTGVLGTLFGRRRQRVWLNNAVDAIPGDKVVVGIEESAFVMASMAAYLLPLLALFAGAVVADVLLRNGPTDSELPAIAGAMIGFAAGVAGLRRWAGRNAGQGHLRILRKEPNPSGMVRFS